MSVYIAATFSFPLGAVSIYLLWTPEPVAVYRPFPASVSILVAQAKAESIVCLYFFYITMSIDVELGHVIHHGGKKARYQLGNTDSAYTVNAAPERRPPSCRNERWRGVWGRLSTPSINPVSNILKSRH